MIEEKYAMAYGEIITILKYIPKEDLKKIPMEKIHFYEENMSKEIEYEIDTTKSLKDQKISDISKAILANLYRDYLASDEEKKNILIRERKELNIIEEEKRKKYNPENIFQNQKIDLDNKEIIESNDVAITKENKKEGILKKVFNFFKNIFK